MRSDGIDLKIIGAAVNNFIKNETYIYRVRNDIHLFLCEFDNSRFHLEMYENLGILLPKDLVNSVKKRQSEFLAGRYAAHKALEKLGIPNAKDIPIGINRAPIWPNNISASISHSSKISICAATLTNSNEYLGVDIEDKITEKTALQIKNQIITSYEERHLRTLEIPFNLALTIAFSAKESLFKAIYPFIGEYFGFEKAVIDAISLENKYLTLRITENLTKTVRKNSLFSCQFGFNDQYVTTLIGGNFIKSI